MEKIQNKEEEEEENNKLIALFMGAKNYNDITITNGVISGKFFITPDGPIRHIESFKYHASWDWLMPVVKKIITEKKVHPIHNKDLMLCQAICDHRMSVNYVLGIELMYQAVVQFIKWYNSQTCST